MPIRSLIAVPLFLVILGIAGSCARPASRSATSTALATTPDEHAGKQQVTVYLGNDRIAPSDVTLKHDQVISWQNESVHLMQVTFDAPADIEKKIRCGLLKLPASERPPWAVFQMNDGRLVGVMPPGRFGSMCELSPGWYAYTVKSLDADAGAGGGDRSSILPLKGTITVQ
jgi:hypothetical protein